MTARTVALFGGSFNPPHVAHQLVALLVLETQAVDELWFLPTWKHPFAKALASFDDRVAMTALAAAALGERAGVSRIEEELAHRPDFVASRTLDTVVALEAAHPGARFRLVIGADILGETDKWYRWDELAQRAPPIVVGRPGYATPPGAIPAIVGVSSTEIRTALAHGDEPIGLLPRAVLRYIADRGLYR
ncbi:MAG TPA: nicotinate-nucleotide adenylyltransferase [Kofleriaceae bacterium]|nr:nicotinate-nucleotide adenylyltransferase [Kofleriaceae bacterium]